MASFKMQARSSADGTIKTWTSSIVPDWQGVGFPGPGSPEHVVAIPLIGGPEEDRGAPTPHRMPIDGDVLCRWAFTETSGPYKNDGILGSAQDMIAVAGENAGWSGGQTDGRMGRALKFSMSTQVTGAIRAPNFTWPTTQMTVSVWFTPTRASGAAVPYRVFFKAHDPVTWSSPFWRATLQYNPNQEFQVGLREAGATDRTYTLSQELDNVIFLRAHHIGFTYDPAGRRKTYFDGYLVDDVAADAGAISLGTGPWCIGNTTDGLLQHAGFILHEARLCRVVRNDAWWLENFYRGMGWWRE